MTIAEFRQLREIPNARVLLDTGSDQLKARRQTFLNRAVDWIRQRVAPDPLAATARAVPHSRFLRAIADSPAYDAGDVSRAEALLTVDVLAGKPLTTRRVAEVIDDIEQRSTEAERNNRSTVAWMAGRGLKARLAERAVAEPPEEEGRALADRIGRAIHDAGGNGSRAVGATQASAITDRVLDDYLADKAAATEAAARAAAEQARQQPDPPTEPNPAPATAAPAGDAETPATAPQMTVRGHPRPDSPDGDPMRAGRPAHQTRPTARADRVGPPRPRPHSPDAAASAGTTPARAEVPTRKELLRELGKAKLPGNVPKELRRLVKTGAVADRAGLARHANTLTAAWVMDNRVGRWYGEALKAAGTRRKIRNGEELMASSRLLDQVRRTIVDADRLLPYAEVKVQARAQISTHVQSETVGRAS